jgi:hypothetical protein
MKRGVIMPAKSANAIGISAGEPNRNLVRMDDELLYQIKSWRNLTVPHRVLFGPNGEKTKGRRICKIFLLGFEGVKRIAWSYIKPADLHNLLREKSWQLAFKLGEKIKETRIVS